MKKEPLVFLEHILESIDDITDYTKGKSYEDFLNSKQLQDAVIRRFEVIGEATKNIPEDFRVSHPEVPWEKLASFRNILIHQYFKVELGIVWKSIDRDLSGLRDTINELIQKRV